MLLSWCRGCPEDVLRRHPDAVCVLMRKLFSFREIPELLRLRALLLDALQPGGAFCEQERENYLGECDLVMSFLRYNDIAAMSVLHRSACRTHDAPRHAALTSAARGPSAPRPFS